MTLTTIFKEETAKFLSGAGPAGPDYGKYGTGGSFPVVGDTDLDTPTVATYLIFTSRSKAVKIVGFEHRLGLAVGNGNTFLEYGIFRNSDSKLFIRLLTTSALDKTSDISFTMRLAVKISK